MQRFCHEHNKSKKSRENCKRKIAITYRNESISSYIYTKKPSEFSVSRAIGRSASFNFLSSKVMLFNNKLQPLSYCIDLIPIEESPSNVLLILRDRRIHVLLFKWHSCGTLWLGFVMTQGGKGVTGPFRPLFRFIMFSTTKLYILCFSNA